MTHGTPAPLHLVPGEDLAEGLRRIVQLELDRLLATIDAETVDDADTVHEVRRTTKRLRAVVRLVRDGAPEVYAEANAGLRDTARVLAADRDATVVAAAARELATEADPETAAAMAPVVAALGQRRDEQATDDVRARLEVARERLATMRWQLGGWDLPTGPATAVLLDGHARTHGRARRALRTARRDPTTASWHEWRKRVKYDRHQTEVLAAAWPPVLDLRADLLHDLTDLLGEDHDLAVLRDVVRDLDVPGVEACLVAAAEQRALLQHAALALGTRLYALPTEPHVDQLRRWWKRAAAEAASSDTTAPIIPTND